MLNKVDKVLIGLDSASATANVQITAPATTATFIADGELVVVNAETLETLAPGSTIADAEKIRIAQGVGGTTFILSEPIDGRFVRYFNGQSYAAAVEQVTTITPVWDASAVSYNLRIVYEDMEEYPGEFAHNYEVVISASETNLATLIDAFGVLIDADADARVTFADGTTNFTLTGKVIPDTSLNNIDEYRQVRFRAYITFMDTDALYPAAKGTVVYTTAPSNGIGTGKLVRDMEKMAKKYRGVDINRHWPNMSADSSWYTVLAKTYDIIRIGHDQMYRSPDDFNRFAPIATVLAIPMNTSTQAQDILNVLNPWMASLPNPQATVAV